MKTAPKKHAIPEPEATKKPALLVLPVVPPISDSDQIAMEEDSWTDEDVEPEQIAPADLARIGELFDAASWRFARTMPTMPLLHAAADVG